MYIDTHTHLSNKFGIKPDLYIKNAIDNNVDYIIVSCCTKEDIIEGLELIKEYDNIFLTIGFHPDQVEITSDSDINWLEELVKENKKIVGIGEIGLDYHYDKENKNKQIDLFVKQLELAKKLDLPVIIHSRDSINDTYEILSNYDLRGDIHCFSGSYEMALKFISLGYYLGIGGVITFSNSKLYQVVEKIGLDHILLETDSPYLSPDRGKINESSNIPIIAERVSDVLSCSVTEVARITTCNAISLFDLNVNM